MRVNGQWVLKPPVLPRRTIHVLALLIIGGIWYGTLMPFGGEHGMSFARAHSEAAGFACTISLNVDALANLLVYVPVGLVLRLAIRRRPARPVREVVLAVLGAAVLSGITEWLQLGRPGRTADAGDIFFNATGTMIGATLAAPLQGLLRRSHAIVSFGVHERPLLFMTIGAGIALAASQLTIVARDEGLALTGDTVRASRVEWLALRFALGLFGFLIVLAASQDRAPGFGAAFGRVFGGLALATAFESLLWLSPLQHIEARDLLSAAAATVIGASLAAIVLRTEAGRNGRAVPHTTRRVVPTAIVLALAVASFASGFAPFFLHRPSHGPAGWAWLPLHSEFPRAWLLWLTDGLVGLVRFGIGGYLLATVTARWSGRATAARVMALAVLGCGMIQYAYLRWTGRWADTVAMVLVFVASAWAARTHAAVTGYRSWGQVGSDLGRGCGESRGCPAETLDEVAQFLHPLSEVRGNGGR